VISQADRRIYCRITDDNDLAKINSMAGFNASRVLEDLPDRQAEVENTSSGDWERIDTEEIGRDRPHYSEDDGVIDEALPV
jgi:hypothetical protein